VYEHFEHTADLGLRVRAPDLDTLFREAAEGLFAMIVEGLSPDPGDAEREIEVRGGRLDHLLFDWLSELLYLFDVERLLLHDFEVEVGADGVRGRARAQRLDPSRHRLLHEVKAITYHGLSVVQDARGFSAELIVDI
jgi:SHS2 domain-containing protein